MSYGMGKHKYHKGDINSLYKDVIFDVCEVSLIKLTAEDIANYKLSLIKKKDETPKVDGNISKDENTFKDNEISKSDKRSKDDTLSKDDNTSKDDTTIGDESAKKKQKVDEIDVLKLILSREGETNQFKSHFKSSLKPNKEIASTSTAEKPMVIDCEESTQSANISTEIVTPKILIRGYKDIMDEDKYIRWMKMMSYDKKPNHLTNGIKKLAVAKPSKSRPKLNRVKHAINSKKYKAGHLIKNEKLYKKYFSKSVQDTIVIIANMLNIISMCNKHHKTRMDESFNKISEAEKLKERYDASQLHGRHKKILESKLKNCFINVVSSFEESEFDSAFQMFFLSILTVLRVLEQPESKKGSIFKNVVLLLRNSLKNSEYNNPKIFSMFRSKTFRSDCIDLISLIEDSKDIDPGVTDRMSLFFVSTVNSGEYFQAVIDTVTGDSNEDLELLINNASIQCSINSKFKDPVDSSTAQHSNGKKKATKTILSTINSDKVIQHWLRVKNPDGTYQKIPVINSIKSKTIGNAAVKPSMVTRRPLNYFYPSFSSSLQKKTNEPSTSKVKPTNRCFFVTPTVSHSPLVQVTPSLSETAPSKPSTTSYVTFKPSTQNKTCSPLNRAKGTVVIGNTQFQLIKGLSSQMRKANTFVKPHPFNNVIIRCNVRNCKKPANIMCSDCKSTNYCSKNCQEFDWYDMHINDCDKLQNRDPKLSIT